MFSKALLDYLLIRGAHPAGHRVGYFLCLFLFLRKIGIATIRQSKDNNNPMIPMRFHEIY